MYHHWAGVLHLLCKGIAATLVATAKCFLTLLLLLLLLLIGLLFAPAAGRVVPAQQLCA
jgi:hypothetical protein